MADDRPRSALLAALAEYRERHPAEAAVADRIASFVSAHADAFGRSCLEGHVTGSAFVVEAGLARVLFVHHGKLDKWLQPGGHCEAGESAYQAALREVLEETGLEGRPLLDGRIFDLDVHPFPERGGVPAHLHYDVRYLFLGEAGLERHSEESHALAWLDLAEAERRNGGASILRPLAKIRDLREALVFRPIPG